MSDSYINKIIDMVADGISKELPKQQLIDDISKMMRDDWVCISGFGDD